MYWYIIVISVNVEPLIIKKCKRIDLINSKY
nr:MAG TPA: hypothetical protein [Caudoviricetes sp.]DAJ93022.1 MAG TPA: hypothetical protein [Caudoviricetes sp.]DAU40825.1 MAG TPA: hypothetical protein [Caudoviricetes sp.]